MHTVKHENVIYKFEPEMEPVLEVESGAIVHFESNDCFFQQLKSNEDVINEIDFDRVNPATGPVSVKGAEPGDLLKVEILAIDLADEGVSVCMPGHGALPDEVRESTVRVIPVKDGYADYLGLKLPLAPMIGVIGVAPSDEEGSFPTATPWRHGGNMDTRDIRKGRTIYFPVAQAGALFALGDCHALMGDGEVSVSGLEIPADVLVRLSVLKGISAPWPILETESETMVIASGKDLEEAVRHANSAVVGVLSRALQVQWEEAYILASLAVDTRISQVVDPTMTVRAAVSKEIISTEVFLENLKK
ncbi:MAG: acetamidase/formamidase family protein [Eubacteriales bacterium]|nr:acetamidase/formamidase family protein [Eubacteriales bacterium]